MDVISADLLASMPPDELRRVMSCLGFESHGDLARRIGVSRSAVSYWLSGKCGVPRPIAMLMRMLVRAAAQEIAS